MVTPEGTADAVRFTDRIVGVGDRPEPGDVTFDLDGAFVIPGLINAHDHLELNHFGRLKGQSHYENATAWIDDLRPRLRGDEHIRRNTAFPLRDRLFIGGLKNLLSGVTTVAHHNPFYRELRSRFPVRVISRYEWAHSFALEGQPVGANGERGEPVIDRCLTTPADIPFIVHAGEGIDAAAADEISRLDSAGCLRSNTVLVHGLALTDTMWRRAVAQGASLVWCPASNVFLFGRTLPARAFLDATPTAASRLCLGTDSRVTGSLDLLEELRVAKAAAVTAGELLEMVTVSAAAVLKLRDAGRIALGQPADLVIVPPVAETAGDALLKSRRGDLHAIVIGGHPMVSDRRFCGTYAARGSEPRPIVIDGQERIADSVLAREIARCAIQEPGVASVA